MKILLAAGAFLLLPAPVLPAASSPGGWRAPHARNPLLPGHFADPSIVRWKGEWFIYATIDPWGGDTLALWRSRDFRNWTLSAPNWPTKAAATSATSTGSKVWAPSVVQGRDGRFWMYVSVGSEVWVGVADHPAGPWRDANGGKPLIPGNFRPGFHMIDAEAFIDDDGQAYLYWGSGLHWANGHCFVVKLKPDMVHFDGEPRDVTPAHYFEAPFMFKANGHYFLTYSYGNTTTDSYQVRYAVGDSPLGPFVEPRDAPILATDTARNIVSPGHHALFRADAAAFILYHRQALPFPRAGDAVLRQIAVDRLMVKGDRIAPVAASHDGAEVPGNDRRRAPGRSVRLTASSALEPVAQAGDDNYATAWRPIGGEAAWIVADLGQSGPAGPSMLRPADPAKPFRLQVQGSADGTAWHVVAADRTVSGSPITIPSAGGARFVRLRFATATAVLEWYFPATSGRRTQ